MRILRALLLASLAACGSRAPTVTLPADPGIAVPTDDLPGGPGPGRGAAGDLGLAAKDPRIVDLDIIRIRGTTGADDREGAVATADLFRAAHDAAKAGNTKDAVGRFRHLVAEFPDSLYAPISLFNIAAIYDGQGDPVSTITTLRELVASYPDARESIEGHLYIAALQSDRAQWVDAQQTLTDVLARTNLTHADRLEAHARSGYIAMEQGDLPRAETTLDAAVAAWRSAPRIDDPYYIAMAHYYRGEILHRQFTAAPVRLPEVQLVKDLEAKRALAREAYDRWKAALAFRHAYWATAAGYQMSQIFVELWNATVKAPIPAELTGAARETFLAQLHTNMHAHLVKALEGHEMNLELAKAFGLETTWSRASATRAVQVKELLAKAK